MGFTSERASQDQNIFSLNSLHTAADIEVVLDDERAAAEEVVLAVELAEHDSVGDILADETDHLALNVVELLFVELEVM